MGLLIKMEAKKMFFKKRMLFVWLMTVFLSVNALSNGSNITDNYGDLFFKYFNLLPLLGLMMYMVFSNAYCQEATTGVDNLIRSSKNAHKIVKAKWIAAGLSAFVLNLSIFTVMILKTVISSNYKGLDLPLKSIWYFKNSGSEITVLALILIMLCTLLAGTLFFTQWGLFISSSSKNAAIPFISGALGMGLLYILEIRRITIPVISSIIHGMFGSQMIRFSSNSMDLVSEIFWVVIIYSVVFVVLPRLTYRNFMMDK